MTAVNTKIDEVNKVAAQGRDVATANSANNDLPKAKIVELETKVATIQSPASLRGKLISEAKVVSGLTALGPTEQPFVDGKTSSRTHLLKPDPA